MSPPPFPLEIFDLIVDLLHDKRTLQECCVVSQSWVPRARRNLFSHILFSKYFPIELWMKAFPDPSSSPAHYARILCIDGPTVVAAAGTSARAWVRAMRYIVELRISNGLADGSPVSLFPLSGLFPVLKSLSIITLYIPPSELLSHICSFPSLKDLELCLIHDQGTTATFEWSAPSTPPELTGTLRLGGYIRSVVRRLLGLPYFFPLRRYCDGV